MGGQLSPATQRHPGPHPALLEHDNAKPHPEREREAHGTQHDLLVPRHGAHLLQLFRRLARRLRGVLDLRRAQLPANRSHM